MFKFQKKSLKNLGVLSLLISFVFSNFAQEQPPKPSAPRDAKIPQIVEKKLSNDLTVATVERKNVPLVTVQMLIESGASAEDREKAGLANLTAAMLTKGTKTRTATQIAEAMEFLGGSINAGAGWNSSGVTVTVTSDKLDVAMAIMADVILNASFKQSELGLLKTQTLDNLAYNLKQPGFLANYVASRYSFDEHPAGGTPETVKAITRADIVEFKKLNYVPANSVLIFAGDITAARANALAQKYFGAARFRQPRVIEKIATMEAPLDPPKDVSGGNVQKYEIPLVRRILVVDLPDSGQAAVNYATFVQEGRNDEDDKGEIISNRHFYAANVLNSILGGGYSSRLNQEIRIKRGLSYGAGSGFAWRNWTANFSTRTQTKNESAAEVAELVTEELKKLAEKDVEGSEIAPRKLVLTGDFGRDLETTVGLANRVAEIYGFGLPKSEFNSFNSGVNTVSADQIKEFAKENLRNGDIIIVGDYSVFKDDLAKRFPNMKIEVVKADELDLSKDNLQK